MISAPLLLCLLLTVYGSMAQAMIGPGSIDTAMWRWSVFDYGCSFAQAVVLPYLIFGLRHRVPVRARGPVVIAAALFAVAALWVVGRPILQGVMGSGDTLWAVYKWGFRVFGAAMLGATIAFTIAARAWTRVPLAAIGAVLATLAMGWLPYFDEKLWDFIFEHNLFARAYWPLRETMWVGSMIAIAHSLAKDSAPTAPDPALAVRSLRRGAIGIAVLAAGGVVTAFAALAREGADLKPMLLGGPALAVAGSLVCASALFDLERARLEGIGRTLLALGALAIVWWAGVQVERTSWLYAELAGKETYVGEAGLGVWLVLGPIIAAGGLLVAAIAAVGARASGQLGTSHIALYVMAQSIAGLGQMVSGTERTMTLTIVLLGAAGYATTAHLFSRLASAIEHTPGLPIARIRS